MNAQNPLNDPLKSQEIQEMILNIVPARARDYSMRARLVPICITKRPDSTFSTTFTSPISLYESTSIRCNLLTVIQYARFII